MTYLLKYTNENQSNAFKYLISKKYLIAEILTVSNETFYMFDMWTLDTYEKRKTFIKWLTKNNITNFTTIQNPNLYIITCIEDGAQVSHSIFD